MGAFLAYCIESGLIMFALFLAYRVFLSTENQHAYNRGVLLGIYAVSFGTVPAVSFFRSLSGDSVPTIISEGVTVVEQVVVPAEKPLWGTVLIWIFMLGMAVVAIRTVVTWWRLLVTIRSGEKVAMDGYTLVVTDDDRFAPFSWLDYIVISRSDMEEGAETIYAHEVKHISCRHWIDLLVAQVACIVNWFNPAVWMMRDELMLVHEYQADMAVIDGGYDPRQYQMLLIKKAVGARFPSLANSLNHSKLKKRITMMYKKKSGGARKIKALALVPMFALGLVVAALPPVNTAISTIDSSEVSVGKGSDNNPDSQKKVGTTAKTDTIAANVKTDGKNKLTVIGKKADSQKEVGTKTNTIATNIVETDGKYELTVTTNGETKTYTLDKSEMENGLFCIVDGKLVKEAEIHAINPDSIESVSISKSTNGSVVVVKKK